MNIFELIVNTVDTPIGCGVASGACALFVFILMWGDSRGTTKRQKEFL